MEKREQISRMAKIIGGCCLVYEDTVCHDQEKHCHCVSEPCVHEITAERLYNAGFKLPDETQENSFSHYLIEELRKHVIHGKQTKVSVNPDLLSDASYHIERLQKRIDMIEKENAIISETLKQVVDEQEASRATQHFCLTRAEDITSAERETLYCFAYWYHDFTTNLGSQYSSHYPMWRNEYFEAVIQMTHRFIETGEFSEFYHLSDLGGQRLIKDYKIMVFKWIDKDVCGIDSRFLPRYIPVNFRMESDPDKIAETFCSGWFATQTPDEQQRLLDVWVKEAKPVIDWVNEHFRKEDDSIVLASGWSNWTHIPEKERAYPKISF